MGKGGHEAFAPSFEDGELFEGLVDARKATGGGVVRDLLFASRLSTELACGLARSSTDTTFGLCQQLVGLYKGVWRSLGVRTVERLLDGVDHGLGGAHKLTRRSIDWTEDLAQGAIEAADAMLAERGGERGDTVRLLCPDRHTKDALLCVTRLLGKLGMDQRVKNPLKLLYGAHALAHAQELTKSERIRLRQEKLQLAFVPSICGRMLQRWKHFMHFAVASYGYQALHLLKVLPVTAKKARVICNRSAIEAMTGVKPEDVIHMQEGGEMYYPGHYVALDRANKHVVCVVRGTMCVRDVLVDLVCESVRFSSLLEDHEDGTVVDGKAHRGFLIAAQRLAAELEPVVQAALAANPGFSLVVSGHSLGAGVATLLTLLWANARTFADTPLQAYAFGAPCSLCHELSQAPFTRRHVTSLVVGDDFVSRLSFSTVSEAQRAIVHFAQAGELSEEEKVDVYDSIPRETPENKLFSAGRVWLLQSPEFNDHAVEIDPRLLLYSLEFTATFLTLHFPSRYLTAISSVASSCSCADEAAAA